MAWLKQKVLLATLLFAAHTVSSQQQSQRLPGMRAEAEERLQIATARIDALTKLSNGATSAEESRERLRQHKENLHTDLKSRIKCNGAVCTLGDSKPAGAGSLLRGAAGLPAAMPAVAEPLKEIAAPLPEISQTDTPATEQMATSAEKEDIAPETELVNLETGSEEKLQEEEPTPGSSTEGAEAEGPTSSNSTISEEDAAGAPVAAQEDGGPEPQPELVPEKDETATEVLEAISEDTKMAAEDEPTTAEEESKVMSAAANEETADKAAAPKEDNMEAGSATIEEPEKMQLPGDHNKMDLVMGAAGVAMVAGVLLIVSRFFKSSEKVEATAGGPSPGPEGGSTAAGVSKRAAVRRVPPAPRPPRTTRPMPAA